MKTILDDFCARIFEITGARGEDAISLHSPSFAEDDVKAVSDVVEGGWVSYQGPAVLEFEQALSKYLGVPHVIAMVNGTTALFICLKAMDIKPGDEVIVPALSFVATANAVVHANAIPHFVDVDEKTLAIDWHKLDQYLSENAYMGKDGFLINQNTKRPIKGIIPVHILGASFDIQMASKIAQKYNLFCIEDSAEALGSKYGDDYISGMSGLGIVSFNGNKIITTGGGGAVCVNNDELANKIRHLTTTAKMNHPYEFIHNEIGYNLRLPALNAALGLSQLNKLDQILFKKRTLHREYLNIFKDSTYGEMFNPDIYGQSNCWLNAFVLKQEYAGLKNDIMKELHQKNIFARPLWKPLNTLDIYKTYPSADCSSTYNIYERMICLPSSPSLAERL